MSFSQIELVWVRVRVEEEWFRVNLREENKVSEFHYSEDESKMTEFKMAEFQDGHHHQVDWISLSQSGGRVQVNLKKNRSLIPTWQKLKSKMAEFKMAAIIKLSQNEWMKFLCKWWGGKVKVFSVQMVGTNLGKYGWVWEEKLRFLNPRWPEFKKAEFKMADIIKLSKNEWVWVRLN